MACCLFASLSPELIFAVSDLLPLNARKQLRLTNHAFGELLAGSVLDSICVFEKPENASDDVAFLVSLAAKGNQARLHIKSIRIGRLRNLILYETPEAYKPEWEPPEKAEDNIIAGFLACKNLRRISGHAMEGDSQWLLSLVLRTIETVQNLRELLINGHIFDHGIHFESLNSLESLSILDFDQVGENLPASVSELIPSCPHLISLEIHNPYGHNSWSKTHSLQALLGKLYEKQDFRRLSLHGFMVAFNHSTLRHIKNLVSLSITGQRDHCPDATHGKGAPCTDICDSSPSLWAALFESGIYLEEVEHDWISESLIEYLSSFSGLRTLQLQVQQFENHLQADAAKLEFFSRAFPKHASSLEMFIIDSTAESQWRCTPDFLQHIIGCPRLKRVGFGVDSAMLNKKLGKQDELPDTNIIKQFLDLALPSLHQLENAALHSAALNGYRRSRCGSSANLTAARTTALIEENIEHYQSPPGCQYLPCLYVPTEPSFWRIGHAGTCFTEIQFPGRESDCGWRLRYKRSPEWVGCHEDSLEREIAGDS
ncbi:hypothetical protein CPB83DRAFT_846985 [Crepidotus variabilis]|uniref:Uncharacterized protein n=1 Tax=Crepidotus variabilis TaxID=179855 RepID=A0A9P6ENX3_9AGAR|nr:hypothetical protein CPB83DRAFT_846985 [Crepidotus variabilis]